MKIVGVTACISGIAHTYLSAEALEDAAKNAGHEIRLETRGSVGAENVLTDEEIEEADVVIVAADMGVPMERFAGKPVLELGTHEVVKKAPEMIERAVELQKNFVPSEKRIERQKSEPVEARDIKSKDSFGSQLYRHFMSGISFMIPFVVSGGIIMAISYAFSTDSMNETGTIAANLFQIGSSAFGLMVPIMAAYVAFSIADRPGLVPGMVGGLLAVGMTNSGFIGGMFAGILAGYTILLLKNIFKFKGGLKAMMPMLILPGISSLTTGLIMIYIIGKPLAIVNDYLTDWLTSLQGGNAIVLGAIVAAMICVDLGGVFCRVSYAFAVATLSTGEPSLVMAAAMAGGLVPSTAMALCTVLKPYKFTKDEIEAGKGCWILGASFIVEGAIPFAARDIKTIIPAVTIGAAVTGALSAFFGCTQAVPHGGIWVLPIPGAIGNIPMFLLSALVGVAITTAIVLIFKKNVTEKKTRAERRVERREAKKAEAESNQSVG